MAKYSTIGIWAAVATLVCGTPAYADVKDGVDAWSRGEFSSAVAEWEGPAAQGDADAMFNMGQAYLHGRGVPADMKKAEDYYSRAAAKGHVHAADMYGVLLFQGGRREMALPYVQDAARRGDARAQYLLGVAHFNGDSVSKDWVRAYAFLTLANGKDLKAAAPALVEMDKYIPMDQRQQAAALAVSMEREAEATRSREMAAANLASLGDVPRGRAPVSVRATSAQAAAFPAVSGRIPQPIESVEVAPSIAAARAAVKEAALVTGTENPSEAGADFARPAAARVPARPRLAVSQPAAPAARPAPAAASQSSGRWKVQLGAFSVASNAERLWSRVSTRPELAGKKRLLVASGRLTKLQAGGFMTRAAATSACNRLKQAGQACLPVR